MPETTRTPLSRERLVAAAMELADADGIETVTMRNVAAAVGVEAMSLYHHLRAGKEGLLEGLVDAVAAEVQAQIGSVGPDGDWRRQVRHRCLAAREVMLRHPWAPALIMSRSTVPPSLFGHFEETLATMIRGGLSYRLGHRALHSLGSMLLGFSQELFTVAPPALAGGFDTNAVPLDMAAAMPHITAMVAAELHDATDPTLGFCDTQTEFEFTLDLLLGGLDLARARVA